MEARWNQNHHQVPKEGQRMEVPEPRDRRPPLHQATQVPGGFSQQQLGKIRVRGTRGDWRTGRVKMHPMDLPSPHPQPIRKRHHYHHYKNHLWRPHSSTSTHPPTQIMATGYQLLLHHHHHWRNLPNWRQHYCLMSHPTQRIMATGYQLLPSHHLQN